MILNIVKEEFLRIGKKTTVCLLTIENGFEVLGTSHCVDPKHFDEEVGREWAKKDAMDKVEMIDGFIRQEELARKMMGYKMTGFVTDEWQPKKYPSLDEVNDRTMNKI